MGNYELDQCRRSGMDRMALATWLLLLTACGAAATRKSGASVSSSNQSSVGSTIIVLTGQVEETIAGIAQCQLAHETPDPSNGIPAFEEEQVTLATGNFNAGIGTSFTVMASMPYGGGTVRFGDEQSPVRAAVNTWHRESVSNNPMWSALSYSHDGSSGTLTMSPAGGTLDVVLTPAGPTTQATRNEHASGHWTCR